MAELFLVEYKGHRRSYCSNTYHHELDRNSAVITEAESGESFGRVLHRWEFDKPPRQKGAPKKILRTATDDEVISNGKLRPKELAAKAHARGVARRLGLQMKFSDVEVQFDGSKMVFYYTADGRVDFRAMVKELATTFRTWIEMRQISPREETRRVGDCGMCGGEVCCRRANLSSIQISTQDARDQDLQLNMSKLTGLCGKLRCCLCFEKPQYLTAKRLFPGKGSRVETPTGPGILTRVDVFNEEALVRLEDGFEIRVSPNQVRKFGENSGETGPVKSDNDGPVANQAAIEA